MRAFRSRERDMPGSPAKLSRFPLLAPCTLSVTSSVHKRGHSNDIAERQRRPARPLGAASVDPRKPTLFNKCANPSPKVDNG